MIFTNEVPSTNMDWRYVWGEFKELLTEIKKLNLKGIRDESCDVYTCIMCALETYTGIPMPIFWMRSANAWIERVKWWENYFEQIGLDFKVEYLRYGANYKKAEKRRVIVELAIKDQIK